MSGWDLGHVVDEGAHDSTLGNWEFGHLFVLRSDGELMYSYYQVYPDRGGIPDDPLLTGEYTLEPMTDDQMAYLDRPNHGDYRPIKTSDGHAREEIQRQFELIVDTQGAALRQAIERIAVLPKFLDTSAYQRTLADAKRLEERKKRLPEALDDATFLGKIFLAIWVINVIVVALANHTDSGAASHKIFLGHPDRDTAIILVITLVVTTTIKALSGVSAGKFALLGAVAGVAIFFFIGISKGVTSSGLEWAIAPCLAISGQLLDVRLDKKVSNLA